MELEQNPVRRIIHENENKLSVLQQLTKWKQVQFEADISCIDASYYMYSLPPNIRTAVIRNCNMELNRLFIRPLKSIKRLELLNQNNLRKKALNENEMRCLVTAMPDLDELVVEGLLLNLQEISCWTEGISALRVLHLFQLNNVGDQVLAMVAKCERLAQFGIGGKPNEFNRLLTEKGFAQLVSLKATLQVFRVRFVAEAGDDLIRLLCRHLYELTCLEIRRNCFDTCLDIHDDTLKELSACRKLESLSLVYFREFGTKFADIIANSIPKLKSLCLRACPLFESIDIWKTLQNLEVLDLSGDSWVRPIVLQGASRLPRLKRFYLGHYDHGETSCEEIVASYPPEGIFVENIFRDPQNFVQLTDLYLQQCCTLTFWLDIRVGKLRPTLHLHYRTAQQFQ